MLTTLLHAKFHIVGSNVSLVTAVKLEAKYSVYTDAMILLYILQKGP